MGPHGAYRGGPLFVYTSGYCAALADPAHAGETTGKPNPLRCPLYTTGFKDSPVKKRLPNMPVKCNLVGETTRVILEKSLDQHADPQQCFNEMSDAYTGAGRFGRDTRKLFTKH